MENESSRLKIIFKRKEFQRAALLLMATVPLAVLAKIFFNYYRELMPYLPPCPSVFFLKIYCPGCGSTRAMYSLFQGNIAGVFANNPILPLGLAVIAALIIKPEWCRHYRLLNAFVILLIVFAVLRNLPWYPFTLLAPAGI